MIDERLFSWDPEPCEIGRRCPSCGERKPFDLFTAQRDYCKLCHARHKRVRHQARKDYVSKLAAQGGVCGACGREPRPDERFHVDHDHQTDQVRGLLCYQCNTAYGALRESRESICGLLRYHDHWSE